PKRGGARLLVDRVLPQRVPEHLVVDAERVHEVAERDAPHAPGRYSAHEPKLLDGHRLTLGHAAQDDLVMGLDVCAHVLLELPAPQPAVSRDLAPDLLDAPLDDLVLARAERLDQASERAARVGGRGCHDSFPPLGAYLRL